MKILALIGSAIILSSCTALAPLVGLAPVAQRTCPVPIAYTTKFMDEAVIELDRLPSASKLRQMINDYGQERDALRVTQP